MTTTLVRGAFAALVVATVAAFFVTQQLKDEFPLVLRFATVPGAISPNGDGVRDASFVGFDLSEPAEVTFSVLDGEGREVRRLVDERQLAGDRKHRFLWNARDDEGRVVPDGIYRLQLVRRDEGRVINSIKEIRVDTRPARVRLMSARPGVIAPGEPGQRPRVRLRYRGPRNEAPEFRLFRTDDGPPRVVLRFRGDDNRGAVWDGLVHGRRAPEGDYAFTVTVRDRAGNLSVAPAEIPSAETARAWTGVSVRRLTLTGPLGVVPAGSLARFRLGPFDRGFDFAVSRLGSRKIVRKGSRIGGAFRVRIPPRTRTGVYVLRVRAGRRRALWPTAVAGLPPSRRAARRPRPLIVLPTITWQGLNRTDDDLDGFADTLDRAPSVRLSRPFDGAGLPPRFRSEISPLLRFLDREKLAYDLTTDLSLARGEGPALGNAPGAAFAGSTRWLTPGLGRRLRRYVSEGGRLAAFGADSFRRGVRLTRELLRDPSARRAEDVFGERTRLLRTTGAPLAVESDRIGVFRGVDRFFGEFSHFEVSEELAADARPLASAGRDPGEPAFVAYRLGKGIVIRVGTAQWSAELSESRLGVEVPRVTKRLWRLLARR